MKIFFAFLLLFTNSVFAQFGSMSITNSYHEPTHDIDPRLMDVVTLKVYFEDQNLIFDTLVNPEFEVIKDSILPGKYAIQLFVNGEHVSTHYCVVKPENISYVEVNTYNYENRETTYSKWFRDSTPPTRSYESELFLSYGRGFLEDKNYPVKNQFGIGYNNNFLYRICNHFAFGLNAGLGISTAYFGKDSTLTTGNHLFERYYQFNINTGIFFRLWQKGNVVQSTYKSAFFDVGANYHLPVVCNYTIKNPHYLAMTSGIHQFTDVSLFSRIGFNHCSLLIQYRLLDYLKAGYPELPKLQVGLSFMLRAYPGYRS